MDPPTGHSPNDMWSHPDLFTTSFIAYTVHIVEDHKIDSYVLAISELSNKHNANNLGAHLLSTLQQWSILPKVERQTTPVDEDATEEVIGKILEL